MREPFSVASVLIAFSNYSPLRRIQHVVEGEQVVLDLDAARLWLTVRCQRSIGLGHYQGESSLHIEIDLPDGRAVVAQGCTVLNAPMSNTITAALPLMVSKFTVNGDVV